MKDAEGSTRLKPGRKPKQAPASPADGGDEQPAAPGSERQRENRRELGAGEDHRTEDMERDHRGTFP